MLGLSEKLNRQSLTKQGLKDHNSDDRVRRVSNLNPMQPSDAMFNLGPITGQAFRADK